MISKINFIALIILFLVTALLFMLCGTVAFAESGQTPAINQSTRQNNDTSYKQTPPNKDIKQPPFKVTIAPPPKNDPERNEYEAERSRNTMIAFGTIAIAGITAIILTLQLIVFNRQARRLGDTVEAMIASERPYLFAKVEWKVPNRKEGDPTYDIRCIIMNRGKTPGIITFADCKLIWEDTGSYDLTTAGKTGAKGVIEAGQDITMWPIEDPPRELWNKKLFCYGKIQYTSIFGRKHETEFHHVFYSSLIGFSVSGNKERNRYT